MAGGVTRHTRMVKRTDKRTGVTKEVEEVYFRARYRGLEVDRNGRPIEHTRHFERERDAKRWRDEAIAGMVTNQWVDPRAGRMTVAEYAAGWEANFVAGDSRLSTIDNALRLHILPVLGMRPISSLLRSDVQGLVKRLSAELAPGTVRNVYGILSMLIDSAVDDRVIPASPCTRITLPADPEVEAIVPTMGQIAAMVDGVHPRYRCAVLTLVGSGLRIGELLGLKVPDVDFFRATVKVARQRRGDGCVGKPKTPASVRTVPLASWVLEELSAHLAAYPPAPGGWIFTTTKGDALTYEAWRSAWEPARERCACGHGPGAHQSVGCLRKDCPCGGYDPPAGDIDTHGLRHAYASALISGGASVKQVQMALGHGSPVVTLRTYTHLWPGDEDRTRSIIGAAFEVLRTQCGLRDHGPERTAGQAGTGGP